MKRIFYLVFLCWNRMYSTYPLIQAQRVISQAKLVQPYMYWNGSFWLNHTLFGNHSWTIVELTSQPGSIQLHPLWWLFMKEGTAMFLVHDSSVVMCELLSFTKVTLKMGLHSVTPLNIWFSALEGEVQHWWKLNWGLDLVQNWMASSLRHTSPFHQD